MWDSLTGSLGRLVSKAVKMKFETWWESHNGGDKRVSGHLQRSWYIGRESSEIIGTETGGAGPHKPFETEAPDTRHRATELDVHLLGFGLTLVYFSSLCCHFVLLEWGYVCCATVYWKDVICTRFCKKEGIIWISEDILDFFWTMLGLLKVMRTQNVAVNAFLCGEVAIRLERQGRNAVDWLRNVPP